MQQVAISRATYKPLYFRSLVNGHVQPGESTRVVSIDTGPGNPSLFTSVRTHFLGYGYTPSSPPTTITQAAEAMHRQPLIPPSTINGLTRSWTGQPRYSTGKTLQSQSQFPAGIEFFYGKLNDTGTPIYSGANFISITEYPRPNAVTRALGTVRFPSNSQALLEQTAPLSRPAVTTPSSTPATPPPPSRPPARSGDTPARSQHPTTRRLHLPR